METNLQSILRLQKSLFHLYINSDEEHFRSEYHRHHARILALRELKSMGVGTSALICPVIPYITDVKPLIDLLADHTEKI